MIRVHRICWVLLLFFLPICPIIRATSIVVLANKTQIGVAADGKVLINGGQAPDECKLLHHGDLYFTFAGTVRGLPPNGYDLRNILVKASTGSTDLNTIRQRFDELAAAPLQRQLNYEFRHAPKAFLQRMKVNGITFLELIIFRVTSAGSEMFQSVFSISDQEPGQIPKLGQPLHRTCIAGLGDCQLTAGNQNGMREYLDVHPFTGNLTADAERLVRFEARNHPEEVGGKITVLLIDSGGVHPVDANDKCPINWGK